MKILVYINIRHDTTAVRIVLQIIDHTIHLIHHPFFVLMFHLHLITIGFSDRTILISPAVPDMTVQIINIIRLLLPDPEHLIHTALDPGSSKSQCREFLRQVIAVDHSEFLNGICRCSVLPSRADFLTLCACSILYNVSAHINKYFICVTQLFLSFLINDSSYMKYHT